MKYLFLSLTFIFALSCSNEPEIIYPVDIDISECFSPELGVTESEQFFYNLLTGEININTNDNPAYSVVGGAKVIFVYRHIFENLSNVIDDEFEERVLFQIDDNIDSFIIDNEDEFGKSECVYGACGGSSPSVLFQNISGSIVGSKISEDVWNIEFDLIIENFNGGIDTIKLNEIFQN